MNSILFVAAITFVLAALGLIGVRKQEAFQLLWNSAGIFVALYATGQRRSVSAAAPFDLGMAAVSA